MQGVPKGLAATIPLSMKYDHVTSFDKFDLNITAAQLGTSQLIEANSPYSPVLTMSSPATKNNNSRNATFSKNMRDLYQKCVVINSEIRADFYNVGTTAGDYLQAGITPIGFNDANVVGSSGAWGVNDPSANFPLERYGTIYTPLRPGAVKSLVTSIAPHKFLGRRDPLTDDQLHVESLDNASPTGDGIVYWAIWVQQVDPVVANDPAPVYVNVTMRHTIVWFEPKEHTRTID